MGSDRAAVVVAPPQIRMNILCILLGLAASAAAVPANSSIVKESRALFSVVKFPNDACTATSGLIGTCLTSTECTSRGGSSGGNCAAGFGVCCLVYSATCTTSTEVSQNNTYLRNPSYPSAYPTSTTTTTCGYKISKAASTVCQLRLDYETLVLGQTAATGVCTDSIATTTTADNSVTTSYPSICGTSSGHHMYINLGSSSETASATITISLAASSASAKWNILVRQIDCDTSYTAPEGCAMFFTGVSGTTTTEHSPNQNFKVCIRREDGYCSIRHSTTTSTSFSLSSQADGTTAPTTGFRGSTDCYLDFITIPSGSLDGSQPAFDRFCGAKLGWTPAAATNQPIISKVVPFTVGVRFDNDDGQDTPYGVALSYQQLPC